MDDVVVDPEAGGETIVAEPESPTSEPAETEMSAAEALAQVTAAAETPPAEVAEAAEPTEAESQTIPAEAAADAPPEAEADSGSAEAGADEPRQTEAELETAPEEKAPGAESTPTEAEAAEAQPTEEASGGPAPDQATPETPSEEAAADVTVIEAATESDQPEAPPSEAAPETAEAVAEKTTAQPAEAAPAPPPDRPEMRAVREAMESRQPIEGRVIGWNHGGFHLALGDLSAFCPRSEMEVGEVDQPESYLDRTFPFRVLRIQGKRQRIVVSRAAHLRNEKSRQRNALRKKLKPGTVLEGTVASLKDFGAFVDLGGTQGLVHVSEISHRRVEHPSHVLSEGQQVKVKVLKVEQGGRRISLSIRALEPDPWKDLVDRFPRGAVVKGTVEKANQIGAFIELAPGLTGLLPARSMSIPRQTTPARAYPPGKEVSVQIVSIDARRQRISLALEGSGLEGSRADYQEYQRQSRKATDDGEGFNALASAFRRIQGDTD